jgi:hypothetical protein
LEQIQGHEHGKVSKKEFIDFCIRHGSVAASWKDSQHHSSATKVFSTPPPRDLHPSHRLLRNSFLRYYGPTEMHANTINNAGIFTHPPAQYINEHREQILELAFEQILELAYFTNTFCRFG